MDLYKDTMMVNPSQIEQHNTTPYNYFYTQDTLDKSTVNSPSFLGIVLSNIIQYMYSLYTRPKAPLLTFNIPYNVPQLQTVYKHYNYIHPNKISCKDIELCPLKSIIN